MNSTSPDESSGLGLLRGVRVIDFTQALSGPYGTLLLADLGADVIKVESPRRGDDARHWGPPFVGDDAAYFMSINRNKRSVALDLKTPEGVAAARRLVKTAAVVVENWRPGTAARLGLRCADPARRQPRTHHLLDQRLRAGRQRPRRLRPDRAGHVGGDVAYGPGGSAHEVGSPRGGHRGRDVRRGRNRGLPLRGPRLRPGTRHRRRDAGQPGRHAHPPGRPLPGDRPVAA